MTVSPKKHVSAGSTVNRGVEAKEVEITNVRLDGTSPPSDGSVSSASRIQSARDDSASYVQVVVQKQRRQRSSEAAPRLPQASSPVTAQHAAPYLTRHSHCCEQAHVSHMHPVPGVCGLCSEAMAAYPAMTTLHQQCAAVPEGFYVGRRTHDAVTSPMRPTVNASEKIQRTSLWQKITCISKDVDYFDGGPERVDVYRLEESGATLCARGSAPTQLERALRGGARAGGAVLAEVLAVPRLLATVPMSVAAAVLREVLLVARDATLGALQTASDYALKPALALAFNALLQPPLVCAAATGRALREALHPLALTLSDAVEPAVRLVGAIRLVHVETRCRCTHAV